MPFDAAARINTDRFRATFEALTKSGATPGGLNRPCLSKAHLEARSDFCDLARRSGFDVSVDGAGNHSAILRCARNNAPTLLLGSHLDSVPNGGRYDGTLGVAAAFETLQSITESDLTPDVHLEVIDFTDEEGTWVSLMGSRAATGQLTEHDLDNPRGRLAEFDQALATANLTREGILGAARTDEDFVAYLEVHIEQGTRLSNTGLDIGVVSGMVGIRMYLVTFRGRADHAGTASMDDRLDAAQGAAAFCLAVRRTVMGRFPDCRANVGRMTVTPGAFNIVPESVMLYLEHRSGNRSRALKLEEALRSEALNAADAFGLSVEIEFLEEVHSAQMDDSICRAVESSADSLGLAHCRLLSLAGHDAQSMAQICPAGLLFVPSVGGFSHSSREFTEWSDCINGANTLLRTVVTLLSAT